MKPPIMRALEIFKWLTTCHRGHTECEYCNISYAWCGFCGESSADSGNLEHEDTCTLYEASEILERIKGLEEVTKEDDASGYRSTVRVGPYEIAIYVKDTRGECAEDAKKQRSETKTPPELS